MGMSACNCVMAYKNLADMLAIGHLVRLFQEAAMLLFSHSCFGIFLTNPIDTCVCS
jgi:hypothetical protein